MWFCLCTYRGCEGNYTWLHINIFIHTYTHTEYPITTGLTHAEYQFDAHASAAALYVLMSAPVNHYRTQMCQCVTSYFFQSPWNEQLWYLHQTQLSYQHCVRHAQKNLTSWEALQILDASHPVWSDLQYTFDRWGRVRFGSQCFAWQWLPRKSAS